MRAWELDQTRWTGAVESPERNTAQMFLLHSSVSTVESINDTRLQGQLCHRRMRRAAILVQAGPRRRLIGVAVEGRISSQCGLQKVGRGRATGVPHREQGQGRLVRLGARRAEMLVRWVARRARLAGWLAGVVEWQASDGQAWMARW